MSKASDFLFQSSCVPLLIDASHKYYELFIRHLILIEALSFNFSPYYVLRGQKYNFLHLTGVKTNLKATVFFEKCFKGVITTQDFSLRDSSGHGYDNRTIKNKLNILVQLDKIFQNSICVTENLKRKYVSCTFAIAGSFYTMGFNGKKYMSPVTILRGNRINPQYACSIDLIMSCPRRKNTKFDTIEYGDIKYLLPYYPSFKPYLSDDLIKLIETP